MLEGAWMCHSLHLDAEHVGHIGVWAAEANIPSPGQRGLSAIAQNIDIGEARVESHRTQLATVRVEIEGIPYLVPMMAPTGPQAPHQSEGDFCLCHIASSLPQHKAGF